MRLCYNALGPKGGKYVSLEPPSNTVAATRKNVSTDWVMMLCMFGKKVVMNGEFGRPASAQHYDFAVDWFKRAELLLTQERLLPHPVRILPGGLESVISGLEELKMGNVKGEKLVCNIAE
jgi:aspyridone synthetase trans-acting enoyl reductase